MLALAGLSGQVWAPDRSLPWFIAGLAWLAAPMAALIVGLCLHLHANTERARQARPARFAATGTGLVAAPVPSPGLMAVPHMMLTAWYLGLLPSLWPDDNDRDPAASTLHLVAASLVTSMAVTQVVLEATLVVFAWRCPSRRTQGQGEA